MIFDNRSFINTPPLFSDNRFNIWQARFRLFLQSVNHELWETIINNQFIPTHKVNDEAVDKPNSLWKNKENRKFEIDFKTKNFIAMSLNDSKFHYVYRCQTTKEIWDSLEMIYRVSPSIKQEKMNTRGKEEENKTLKCFSKLRNYWEVS